MILSTQFTHFKIINPVHLQYATETFITISQDNHNRQLQTPVSSYLPRHIIEPFCRKGPTIPQSACYLFTPSYGAQTFYYTYNNIITQTDNLKPSGFFRKPIGFSKNPKNHDNDNVYDKDKDKDNENVNENESVNVNDGATPDKAHTPAPVFSWVKYTKIRQYAQMSGIIRHKAAYELNN